MYGAIDGLMMEYVSEKTPFGLIERVIGGVTYEHCLAHRFYNDIWIGDAERNLYVDRNHEICLCAHYNFRVIGKYEFIPEYRFYITKKRMSLDLHWNLGNISDKSQIIETFNSLEETKGSPFYNDFCLLKTQIDEKIKTEKENLKAIDYDSGTISQRSKQNKRGKDIFRFFETPIARTKEYAQILLNLKKDEWTLSVTKEPIIDMYQFFDDFLELDENELHLRKIIPMRNKELPKKSPYYKLLQFVKEELGLIGGVVVGQINVKDIGYMKYIKSVCSFARFMDGLPSTVLKEETYFYPDGRIVFHKMIENYEKVNKRTGMKFSPKKINRMFEDISKYLSNKRLKQEIFYDNTSGTLIIYYKDGHKEEYDRALSCGDDCLYFHILNVECDREFKNE